MTDDEWNTHPWMMGLRESFPINASGRRVVHFPDMPDHPLHGQYANPEAFLLDYIDELRAQLEFAEVTAVTLANSLVASAREAKGRRST
jgi:hypothetical protein